MKINGTEYTMPELNFNTMCKLEDMGVSLTEMDQKVLTTVRGFLALAMGDDMEKAGMEIEQHLASGGSLDPLMESINKAVNESGFFRALSQSQEKGNAASTETSWSLSISQAGSMGCTQVTAWGQPSGKTCSTRRNRFRSSDRRRRYRKTLTGKPNISAPMQLCSINSSKKKEEPHHAAM